MSASGESVLDVGNMSSQQVGISEATSSGQQEREIRSASGSIRSAASSAQSRSNRPVPQRIRPGILSRQASEREEADSGGYQLSASEDDEGRQSDSGMLPQRFPPESTTAGPPLRVNKTGQKSSPLSTPSLASGAASAVSSGSQSHSSGGEANAASSRSHLPIQSKTSLYRRQASGDSVRGGGDWSEDGGPNTYSLGSSSLNRAKSISSVSSINSTSSMEAVPFQAAPLGNVRVGYGGYGTGTGTGAGPSGSTQGPYRRRGQTETPQRMDEHPQIDTSGLPSTSTAAAVISPRQRLLPKGPSDDWHYRNAPGMGSRQGARSNVGTFSSNVMLIASDGSGRSSPAASDGHNAGFGSLDASGTSQSPSRAKPSIRSKLAKRAGKLGLKPLTNMVVGSSGDMYVAGPNFAAEQMAIVRTAEGSSATVSNPSGTSQAGTLSRISSETSIRAPKSYFSNPDSLPDGESMVRTSSVTLAPLVVSKHPKGPPGSGPAPSPGLIGPPSPFHPYALASPKLSPRGLDENETGALRETTFSADDTPRRSGDGGVDVLAQLQNLVFGDDQRGLSPPAPVRTPSPAVSRASRPTDITPAQQIQRDAEAGIAKVPSEPSEPTGATPRLDSSPTAPQMEGVNLNGEDFLGPGRPHSVSISTVQTLKAGLGRGHSDRPSSPGGSSNLGASRPGGLVARRPHLLRALTSESLLARRSAEGNHDGAKGAVVDENTGVSTYWSGRPMRSGSASPKSSSTSSYPDSPRKERSPPFDPASQPYSDSARRRQNTVASGSISPLESMTQAQIPAEEINPCSPEKVTKALDAIQASSMSSDGGAIREKSGDDCPLPSSAVSSASASIKAVAIKDPQPKPARPGQHIPRTEPGVQGESLGPQPDLPSRVGTLSPVSSIGQIERSRIANSSARSTRVSSDFTFGDILGEGSYSTVMEAWDMKPFREGEKQAGLTSGKTGCTKAESNIMGALVGKRLSARQRSSVEGAKVYAVKVLDKVHILKEKKQKYVGVEREALSLLIRQPGVITLFWTFQDRDSLYFVLELAPNGELLSFIKKLGSFDLECTRYYSAQLVETIGGMHEAGVLHRDLKPENVLLDAQMRIKIADFGSAKLLKKSDVQDPSSPANGSGPNGRARASSFVGTAEYVSPELLTDKNVSEASDWWALGCLIFQMLCGRPPFKGASEYQTFQKIMKREFELPAELDSDSKALVNAILVLEPDQRPKRKEMRAFVFFEGIDWTTVWTQKAPELKAGIYVKPQVASPSSSRRVSVTSEGDANSCDSPDGNMASVSEDESKSVDLSAQSSSSINATHLHSDLQDADDDDSSFSEQSNSIAPRRRGFSVGAQAAERMMAAGSIGSKRASNFIRIAMGASVPSEGGRESGQSFDSNPSSYRGLFNQAGSNRGSLVKQGSAKDSTELDRFSSQPPSQAADIGGSRGAYHALTTSWAALLLPNESLLYSCPILHRTTGGLLRSSTKRRQLLLTDFPRLLCVKETNDQLRVKSEVILGLPKLASRTYQSQWDEDEDDEDEEDNQDLTWSRKHAAAQMRRQSSAGPLLTSPARPSLASVASMEGLETQKNRLYSKGYVERRESFPLPNRMPPSSQLSSSSSANTPRPTNSSRAGLPSTDGNGSSSNNTNNNNHHHNNHLNGSSSGPIRQPGMSPSATTPAVLMDTSPNFLSSVEQKNIRSFVINTPAKSYLYEDPSGDATHWVKSISMAANRGRAGVSS